MLLAVPLIGIGWEDMEAPLPQYKNKHCWQQEQGLWIKKGRRAS
jgi:hypothetical protein